MPVPVELPPPRDWQVFEDSCRDLFAAAWGDPETKKYGRSGQKQHGVDILGLRNGRWQGVQCKRKRGFPEKGLTEKEVRTEVEAARRFPQPLETLVIATTAPADAALLVAATSWDPGERPTSAHEILGAVEGIATGKAQGTKTRPKFAETEETDQPPTRSAGSAEITAQPPREEKSDCLRNKRILLVEDIESTRRDLSGCQRSRPAARHAAIVGHQARYGNIVPSVIANTP